MPSTPSLLSQNAAAAVPLAPAPAEQPPGPTMPAPAALSHPCYYLHNVAAVLAWVQRLHADLFTPNEHARFQGFHRLPRQAQALLVRLVMRSHAEFRVSQLQYAELGKDLQPWVQALLDGGWLQPDPLLTPVALNRLLRVAELRALCLAQPAVPVLPARSTKGAWLAALVQGCGLAPRPLSQWWPHSTEAVVALTEETLAWFVRVRLMFFGNLRQDWREFILTELGHQRYPPLVFAPESRAFAQRHEVDLYLHLAALQQQLEAGEDPARIWSAVGPRPANAWLAHRRSRLLLALGVQAARQGSVALALEVFEASEHPEACLRALRLREKNMPPAQLWPRLTQALSQAGPAEVQSGLQRLAERAARRLGLAWQPALRPEIPQRLLCLPETGQAVELAVAAALSDTDSQCHYVENTLFPGLLALLCWPAIYAPLPGAFFHPFQAGPADLYRPDFGRRRASLLQTCLNTLRQDDYPAILRERWHRYAGLRCRLVAWPALSLERLELAVQCIPAEQLLAIFRRLLEDLRHHCRGLPDLIRFWPEQRRFALIEVKAPGDRLQDHQQAWLAFCLSQGVAVEVCHVQWQRSG